LRRIPKIYLEEPASGFALEVRLPACAVQSLALHAAWQLDYPNIAKQRASGARATGLAL